MSNKLRNRSKSVCIPREQKLSEKVEESCDDEESGETVSFINNTTIKTEKFNEYSEYIKFKYFINSLNNFFSSIFQPSAQMKPWI